jgi:glucose-6-phosphate isomerase
MQEQKKDPLSFRSLVLMPGVGGRFSEFNMGLLHLAIAGVDIGEVFAGARAMYIRCTAEDLLKNPASLYAALQTILYTHKGKSLAVMMPFAESLKSTADWYVQLLAESLGKKYRRKILISSEGLETWKSDLTRVVNEGRTPISSRGTNDLHSIQQNNIEGRNDKTVTFIRVEKFRTDIEVTGTGDFLSGRRYSELMKAAQEATEWALVRQQRPNCTILMPELSAYCWGQLLFFFEMATAFEGELLDVNAFDQPGVEGYKNYMYYTLRKPGLAQDIASEIKQNPLVKKKKYIL